jgi:hypothetical protein
MELQGIIYLVLVLGSGFMLGIFVILLFIFVVTVCVGLMMLLSSLTSRLRTKRQLSRA